MIKVVNPNTTESMTAEIGRCAQAVAGPGTDVDAVTSAMGPPSIESHYDEAMSVPGLLEEIRRGERAGADGYVIACFGDPGLDAARELARGPVVGIAEAAMHTASLPRPRLLRGHHAGAHPRPGLANSRTLWHGPVLPGHPRLRDPGAGAGPGPGRTERVVGLARAARSRDGSDVMVLGCAGMADLRAVVSERSGCRWSTGSPRRR